MPSPKDNEEKLERILTAWRTLAPDKTFGGMTLAQFEAACAPSRTTRAVIDELQDRLTQAIADRDEADRNTASKIQLVVAGVVADPDEGPDSALYAALGFIRKSARKTGLTRKRKEPEKK